MLTIAVFAADEISCGRMRRIQIVTVTVLVARVHPSPNVPRVFVLLSTHMPMCVRARQPCSQQGYTDEQSDSRSCLAETVQHPG